MSDNKTPAVLALGYFDSVHRGHKKVIETAKKQADLLDAKTVVFTFKGNLRAVISNKTEKQVFMPSERADFIHKAGADEIYFAPTNSTFLSKGKLAFLNFLNKKYNVVCYVCGEDYRFGKFGQGDIEYVKKYAIAKNQTVLVVETEEKDGERISTTAIKKMLIDGNVKGANAYLGRSYSISGVVYEDRKIGKKLGFPTLNIKIDQDKHRIKDGVYAGHTYIDGKFYKAVINYGARPTYSLTEKLVEAHIVDFNGQLYGKQVTVFFDDFLRSIQKFKSEEELKKQLNIDVASVKGIKYD